MEKTNSRNQGQFLILLALLDAPKHGYEISKFVEERSNGFFRMPFGTLYPALHRLEKSGLIAGGIHTDGGGREKKIYRLTAAGKRHAQGEVAEYQSFAKAIGRLIPT